MYDVDELAVETQRRRLGAVRPRRHRHDRLPRPTRRRRTTPRRPSRPPTGRPDPSPGARCATSPAARSCSSSLRVALLATVVVGVYGLVRGPGGRRRLRHRRAGRRNQSVSHASGRSSCRPRRTGHSPTRPIRSPTPAPSRPRCSTGTPASGFLPTDYTAAVLADADPSGEETPGLIDDVATYLPTVDQWLDLGAMDVVQTIDDRRRVRPGLLDRGRRSRPTASCDPARRRSRSPAPGTAAASGTASPPSRRTRSSFTVFVACPPVVRPLPRPAALPARQPAEVTRAMGMKIFAVGAAAAVLLAPGAAVARGRDPDQPRRRRLGQLPVGRPGDRQPRRRGPGPGEPQRDQHQRRDRHPQPAATHPSRGDHRRRQEREHPGPRPADRDHDRADRIVAAGPVEHRRLPRSPATSRTTATAATTTPSASSSSDPPPDGAASRT